MSGPTENFMIYPVIAISLIAACTDLVRGRIYNWLTFSGLVLGALASFWLRGVPGIWQSLAGIGLALALYGWMFWLGYLGGGDLKFLMALGAWGGPLFTLDVALLAIFLGGALAATLLIAQGHALEFSRKLGRLAISLLVHEMEVELPKLNRKLTLPYGVPMALAAIWVLLANPMERWGLRPW